MNVVLIVIACVLYSVTLSIGMYKIGKGKVESKIRETSFGSIHVVDTGEGTPELYLRISEDKLDDIQNQPFIHLMVVKHRTH